VLVGEELKVEVQVGAMEREQLEAEVGAMEHEELEAEVGAMEHEQLEAEVGAMELSACLHTGPRLALLPFWEQPALPAPQGLRAAPIRCRMKYRLGTS
jgi:hypothetical protein